MDTPTDPNEGQAAKEYRQIRFRRPSGATEILLVRHGESCAASPDAPFPLVDGHGDPELHPNGRDQALRIAARLKHQPIAAVYVTNLQRTAQTAAPLCEQLDLTPIVEPDLREVFLGEWEGGVYRQKIHDRDPLCRKMMLEQRWDVIPGAESFEQLQHRLHSSIERIVNTHAGELVVAVVHGGVIGQILAHATGARPFAFIGADNGSISHIVAIGERMVVRTFNDTAHLSDTEDAVD